MTKGKKIYVGHATSFDFINELYLPLTVSKFWDWHTFILPHEENNTPVFSKNIITECDYFIAEVSHPSTGLGIELGWAHDAGCEILCLYRENSQPSAALKLICANFICYRDLYTMIDKINQWIDVRN